MEQLTPEKVIQLRMPAGDNEHSKSYTLNDLKDLQSKLMLIAAKASKGKDEIDRFLDVGFCLLPGIHWWQIGRQKSEQNVPQTSTNT